MNTRKTNPSPGTVMVTGASSGIGALYADRLAERGHELVLVARNSDRLDALARRLTNETGRSVTVLVADLNNPMDLARVEHVLRTDASITMLVNNAGISAPSSLLECDIDRLDRMIDVNVTALVHLSHAVLPGFIARGGGSIINIASIAGVAPELLNSVYGGTKAFVLAFSRALQKEFTPHRIRVQAVLPGATATEFWEVSGTSLSQLPDQIVMAADDMVDAALAGFDQGEAVTIPSLPDAADWADYEAARERLLPNLSRKKPAARYDSGATIRRSAFIK